MDTKSPSLTQLIALSFAVAVTSAGCAVSTHAVAPATMGVVRSSTDLEADLDQPGPVVLETVVGAEWEVDRSGLIDLGDPVAKAAHLGDGPEPIQIYFHVLRHPTRGTFLVDTGVEHLLRDDPDRSAIRGLVASVMHREKIHVKTDTAAFLAREPSPLAGVFLTHMHLDHVAGMPDVPKGTPIFAGPGETSGHAFLNMFIQPNIDRQLAGQAPVLEWQFAPDPAGRFAGVLDVFGDRSVWAIWAPGHTPGGPVLLTGDVCHTAWGWEHDVGPGTFTADHAANAESLRRLRALAARHPKMDVRLGHQALAHPVPVAAVVQVVREAKEPVGSAP